MKGITLVCVDINDTEVNSMNLLMLHDNDVFGMANVVPKRSGLSVDIWSDHNGYMRNVSHRGTPRAKITSGDIVVSISIEEYPRILAKSRNMKRSEETAIRSAMNYVGRNYDIFLNHYMDSDFSFDDEDLFNALRERGEYR